jgi:ubiquinone/menaquinone biosynthesis C-methylase UbiE
MNPFTRKCAAVRYASGRPYFHPIVISRVRERLALKQPLSIALDVGCGTGLSSVALLEITKRIVGVDSSADMIALAARNSRINYVIASAEYIPFNAPVFDLITLSEVIHWLDWLVFLEKARSVLQPQGALVIYDNFFVASQPEAGPEFKSWFTNEYLRRYPKPPRAIIPLEDSETWQKLGFRLFHFERYENVVNFSAQRLMDYLLTQSAVIVAVEGGRGEIGAVRSWLSENIKRFFKDSIRLRFRFEGPIAFLQRAA